MSQEFPCGPQFSPRQLSLTPATFWLPPPWTVIPLAYSTRVYITPPPPIIHRAVLPEEQLRTTWRVFSLTLHRGPSSRRVYQFFPFEWDLIKYQFQFKSKAVQLLQSLDLKSATFSPTEEPFVAEQIPEGVAKIQHCCVFMLLGFIKTELFFLMNKNGKI